MIYSYIIVGALALFGLAFPAAAGPVLAGPLLLGLLLLGVAHGACDHQVVPALRPAPARGGRGGYWGRFLSSYLGLAAVALALWHWAPTVAVAAFFVLTGWHWGSADAPVAGSSSQWRLHSALRGCLLFAVPGAAWPAATAALTNGLLAFAGGQPLSAAGFAGAVAALWAVLGVGMPVLWLRYLRQHRADLVATDALETALLVALLVALPPVLASGVYFVGWHSLQHVRRLNWLLGFRAGAGGGRAWLAAARFFGRQAWPLLLLSVLFLTGLYGWLATQAPLATFWLPLALVCASVVTLPHALLVTLVQDADGWRHSLPPTGPAPAAALSFFSTPFNPISDD